MDRTAAIALFGAGGRGRGRRLAAGRYLAPVRAPCSWSCPLLLGDDGRGAVDCALHAAGDGATHDPGRAGAGASLEVGAAPRAGNGQRAMIAAGLPLVTVIMPVRDEADFIARSLGA